MQLERVNAPWTVSGRLRSTAPHARSVRKDDIIRQRNLSDGFLRGKVRLTFAIENPECPISPIRRDKVKIICVYTEFGTRRPQTLILRHKRFKM